MTVRRYIWTALLSLVLLALPAIAAGPRTHAEIGQRAWDQHLVTDPEMLPGLAGLRGDDQAMRAFYCGATFPDFGHNKINHEAAEYAHWYPYQQAYFEYMKEHFPPPWDDAARREIAFFLGILCHGVGDTPWHFDEDGHKSLLTMARETDRAGHGLTEHITDIFSHVLFDIEPDPRSEFVWLTGTAQAVFERAGVAVTPEELARGCRKLEGEWFRGAHLGPIAYPYFQAKIPWCRAHYEDYYYGGLEHGAALTAMCIRYYYARLNGWHYYQNIPIQACAFPRGEPYTPCMDAAIPAGDEEAGGSILTVGHGACARLRFDVSDIASPEQFEGAALWLRLVDGPVAGAVEITGHAMTGEDAADHEPSPRARPRMADVSSSWMVWDVTALVRQWVREPAGNYGMLLKTAPGADTDAVPAVRFYSSSALKARPDGYGGTVVAFRPILVVR
ncbi:MAG TPA: zinc dependent phospholipase C family protein [Candidatus Hydrogenedentes bacterium]|nr:zinc dependent phospholipase C family protein [Candidatus Hydrogenedentota bacterium]HQE81777.1 zinc dependent phospholipase C family protein [Candidatus Hydrogenedentota bacterium]HQH53410.1 zinc dependent phospholipase C family protein [Candidatus Hydrogenedentota bacterium]HQM51086.1 zinc dependent phospholipase C family protein [Candidatus Hydrogenedentota bacterium]